MKGNYIFLPLVAILFFCYSCSTNTKEEKSSEEKSVENVYDKKYMNFLNKAKSSFQIDNSDRFRNGFYSALNISTDSADSYLEIYEELYQENFHLDDSLDKLIELKEKSDYYTEKFSKKGISDYCEAIDKWNEFYNKPKSQYLNWLTEHKFTQKEFEEDIVFLSVNLGRRCRIIKSINSGKTLGSTSSTYSSKYSRNAVDISKSRVESWISRDIVVIKSKDLVYINPTFWNSVDYENKKEMLSTILIYTEVFSGREERTSLEFKDKNTGKDIGSYSVISGLKIR